MRMINHDYPFVAKELSTNSDGTQSFDLEKLEQYLKDYIKEHMKYTSLLLPRPLKLQMFVRNANSSGHEIMTVKEFKKMYGNFRELVDINNPKMLSTSELRDGVITFAFVDKAISVPFSADQEIKHENYIFLRDRDTMTRVICNDLDVLLLATGKFVFLELKKNEENEIYVSKSVDIYVLLQEYLHEY